MHEKARRGASQSGTGLLGDFAIFCLVNYSSFTDWYRLSPFEVINLALDTRSIFLGP